MREAVIVSTARTPIAKAYRGAFNNLSGPTMAAHAICAAIKRAGVEAAAVEDLILGCALTQGTTGINVARHAVMAANLPVGVAAATIDRQCASGLSAISAAAQQIVQEGLEVAVAGGLDSISLVQNTHMNNYSYQDQRVLELKPEFYHSMIQTAETVAARYHISRAAQDEYALASQQKTAAALRAGKFDAEIIPVTATQVVSDKVTGEDSLQTVQLDHDECNRPDTTLQQLAKLKPVLGGNGCITAGNASQLSDGASAVVVLLRATDYQVPI
ncbi:MAG TPA: hypothetical protein ENI62_03660 [Gammaproteobacteria bacterium]|nr:hypothetical protein [Gammaproteobacteria bacterium]